MWVEEFSKEIALALFYLVFVLTLVFNILRLKSADNLGFLATIVLALPSRRVHLFQFTDIAAVISGQEQENQILLSLFVIWCKWADMMIRVDKLHLVLKIIY